MANAELSQKVSTRKKLAAAGIEDLLASLTSKAFTHQLEIQKNTNSPTEEVVFRRNIEIATALDPLRDIPYGKVLGKVRRQMRDLEPKQLISIDLATKGILSRSTETLPLPEDYQNGLSNLGAQARRKLQRSRSIS